MIIVWVTDRKGNYREQAPLTWSVTSGRGSVMPLDTVTLSGGTARAVWTLGPDVGSNVLVVRSGAASATVIAEAAAPLKAMSIAPGAHHSCALAIGGAAYCWGDNSLGQLGHGWPPASGHDSLSKIPDRVATNLAFSALASRAHHTCGLSLAGEAFCWGMSYESGPTRVSPLRFIALTTGYSHTCGLTADGSAYCWGSNESAQLGAGVAPTNFTNATTVPTRLADAPPFVSISAGGWFTCGLTADGRVFCWGSNETGQLGATASDTCVVAQYDDSAEPLPPRIFPCSYRAIQANLNSRITQIAAGPSDVCASTAERTVVCWGWAPEPYTVVGATGLTGIAQADFMACGLDADGRAWCWDGPGGKPQPLPGGIRFSALFGGWSVLCGVSASDSAAYCWGWNERGQLGDGTTSTNYRAVPVPVVSPPG